MIASLNDERWNSIGAHTRLEGKRRVVALLTSTAKVQAVGKIRIDRMGRSIIVGEVILEIDLKLLGKVSAIILESVT
jgi:hypothetical protein